MRILLVTPNFPPEIGSASHLFYELSNRLSEGGHTVTVVTMFPRAHNMSGPATQYKGVFLHRETENGVTVLRLQGLPIPRDSVFARGLEHFMIPFLMLLGAILSGSQDVLLIYSPPLPVAAMGCLMRDMLKARLVVNVQDLYPQAVVDLGLLRNRFLIRLFEAIERFVYQNADFITVHSEGNRRFVIDRGAPKDRTGVIPNWADTDFIKPGEVFNQFRKENGIGDEFVVSYAGIMSHSQDLETIIDAANILRSHRDILFVLVGDGPAKKRCLAKARSLKLSNVKFWPFQPRELYPRILQGSDVCLVTLRKDNVKTPVVPGKLASIMASGRPVIASVPLDGDTPKIVQDANCGFSVQPERPLDLANAILELHRNRELGRTLGQNAREYAEERFSLSACSREYEEIFSSLTS